MSPARISITRNAALDLADIVKEQARRNGLSPVRVRSLQELERALDKARSPKRKAVRASRVRAKISKKATKRIETSAIWTALMARADGKCEACTDGFSIHEPATLDHFWGRAKAKQSVQNCWLLHGASCHRKKTDSIPSRETWLADFGAHCEFHGYGSEVAKVANALAFVRTKSRLSDASAAAGARHV